jgi:hypothetical protein
MKAETSESEMKIVFDCSRAPVTGMRGGEITAFLIEKDI